MTMSRRVLGLLAILLFLAGCGGAQTFPRTTVPVKVDKSRANDPRLSLDKLSEVDPCKVLQALPVDRFGGAEKPPKPEQDLRQCEVFLKPSPGTDQSRLLTLDIANYFNGVTGAESTIGGMPAREERDGEICTVDILTDQKNKQGIQVSYSAKNKDCKPADLMAKRMLETIRDTPPKWGDSVGSVKPCELLDPMVTRFLGGNAEVNTGGPADLWHECPIRGKNGMNLTVSFVIDRLDPVDYVDKPKQPMPLGNGVTGMQIIAPGEGGCRIDWTLRKVTKNTDPVMPDPEDALIGRVNASAQDKKGKEGELCKVAVETAKFVVSKTPKQ